MTSRFYETVGFNQKLALTQPHHRNAPTPVIDGGYGYDDAYYGNDHWTGYDYYGDYRYKSENDDPRVTTVSYYYHWNLKISNGRKPKPNTLSSSWMSPMVNR